MALNKKKTIVIICTILLAVLFSTYLMTSHDQTKPIELVEPFPAGSFEVHVFLEQHSGG
jgi:hypothetical protein